ncbi:twin-arginine translocase TatA/TatE family subunit [Microbacterium gorillae]|uniref:twin-arginine translocase TatA/TatE family subunit n=1 Tax=Microbacterium gorillae TaxID=1231063 RepID=UPI00058D731D|nr:twin-arginine translocase TatA/TatE family subunit [Microbacterium gorillae]
MGIFGNAFGWPHLLLILAVILLVFGAAKLPALAKSMGQSARVFKGEMKAMKADDAAAAAAEGQTQNVADASTAVPGSPATPIVPPAKPTDAS